MLFVFSLFSFVITDAGTQLRKYLAGSDVCDRQLGRIFLFNDCAFCLLASAWIFVRIHDAEASVTTVFTESRMLGDFAQNRSMRNKILFSAAFRICDRPGVHWYVGMNDCYILAWNRRILLFLFLISFYYFTLSCSYCCFCSVANINTIIYMVHRIKTFYLRTH